MNERSDLRFADGETFHDTMTDQLRRAPWILFSVAAHGLLFMFITLFARTVDVMPAPPAVVTELDRVEQIEEIEDVVDVIDEKPEIDELLHPEPIPDANVDSDPTDDLSEETKGETSFDSDVPMNALANMDVVGLGATAGGSLSGGGGLTSRRKGGTIAGELAVDRGLEWLARHQSPDGSWDADGFMANGDPAKGSLCDGKGGALFDVGVSGLALLAFLGAGETHRSPVYGDNMRRGLRWLQEQQDIDGAFGSRTAKQCNYNHAIATLAMSEAYGLTRVPTFKESAQRGVDFISRAQNPYKAWRYGVADGENDTSITGWMVMALKSAKNAGLDVGEESLKWASSFIDDMTDEETGRTGYNVRGGRPVRHADALESFPAAEVESLTAVGLICRIFAGENPRESKAIKAGVNLLLEKLPVWNQTRGTIDMYYWYYGTLAMYQVGGSAWTSWNSRADETVIETQRKASDGNFGGSWDPIGAWGLEGGRVYATALQTLSLEVHYRYGRVFGTK